MRLTSLPFLPLIRSTGAPEHAGRIRKAIRLRQVVEMTYADGRGVTSHRRIRPLAIWTLAEGWMFSGWCEWRGDFRTFRFDRIIALTVTGAVFEEEVAKGLAAFLAADLCEAAAK